MECLFYSVKKSYCSLYQRCEGIYLMMLNLGADKKNATAFSKYVWRRSLYNKFKDVAYDSSNGFFDKMSQPLVKLILKLSKPLVRDYYGIERKLTAIENIVFDLENKSEPIDPLTYFKNSGEGYGLIFKTTALLSNCSSNKVKEMTILGRNLGALIAMRDSIQDRHLDAKTNNYNPFKDWSKDEIMNYYYDNRNELISEFHNFLTKLAKDDLDANNDNQIFHKIRSFALASTTPFGLCKKHLQSSIKTQYSINALPINYLTDPNSPEQPEEDHCRINCCASTADEVCHIPNNPCRCCCSCCDCCGESSDWIPDC